MTAQKLADDFFLTGHDSAGRRLLPQRIMGIGLSSALLGELLLIQSINIRNGLINIVPARQPDDPLAASVLGQLGEQSRHRYVRDWIDYLVTSAEEAVAGRLARAGHIRRWERPRRLLRAAEVLYPPTDQHHAGTAARWLSHELGLMRTVSQPDALLAGLILATNLDQDVLWDLDVRRRQHVMNLLTKLPQPLRELIHLCETAVGEAVLSHRT